MNKNIKPSLNISLLKSLQRTSKDQTEFILKCKQSSLEKSENIYPELFALLKYIESLEAKLDSIVKIANV